MNPSQIMNGSSRPGTTRRTAASMPVGAAPDDRRIPAFTAALLIGAGLTLIALDKAKFKMVVGVS